MGDEGRIGGVVIQVEHNAVILVLTVGDSEAAALRRAADDTEGLPVGRHEAVFDQDVERAIKGNDSGGDDLALPAVFCVCDLGGERSGRCLLEVPNDRQRAACASS